MAHATNFMKLGVLLVPEFCTDSNLRLVKQCGAESIVLTCPGFSLDALSAAVARIRSFGLSVDVIERFVPHDKIVHGLPGREEQIENIKKLIRNMGVLGVKVLCYNWMPSDDVRGASHTRAHPSTRAHARAPDHTCTRTHTRGVDCVRPHSRHRFAWPRSGLAPPRICQREAARSRPPLTCVDECARSRAKRTTPRW